MVQGCKGKSTFVKVSKESFNSSVEEHHSSAEPTNFRKAAKMLNLKGHKKSTTLLFPNDSSSSCKSSTLSIYSQSYALATKKWKICEKVEMVTSSVENLINDQGETVIRLLKVAFARGKKSSKANKWCLTFSAKWLTRWVWKELSVNLSLKSRGQNTLNWWQYLIAIYCCVNWRPEYLMMDDRCC